MNRYYLDEVETDEGDPISDGGLRRFIKKRLDHPLRSPIRRKDKLRQEGGVKPKAKRNLKKVQYKIKYDWQGE